MVAVVTAREAVGLTSVLDQGRFCFLVTLADDLSRRATSIIGCQVGRRSRALRERVILLTCYCQ